MKFYFLVSYFFKKYIINHNTFLYHTNTRREFKDSNPKLKISRYITKFYTDALKRAHPLSRFS